MTPNQAVEFLAIDQIAPYPRNPRTHPEANVAKLMASIKEFGWTTPILVDEDGAVLAGHGRLLAARALLMAQVPCLRIPGLSSAQKRAYRLADNRLTLDSDWDLEMLALELQELGEFDLELTGFDPEELDDILSLNIPEEDAADRELSDSEQNIMDQAWCRLLEDWDDIATTAKKRAWVSSTYTKGALAVLYLRSLFFGDEIPRSATLAYTKNRAFTDGERGSIPELFRNALSKRALRNSIRWSLGEQPSFDSIISGQPLAIHGHRMPNDFPALLARDLMNEFCPDMGRVLDPCHGWGGRLLGFLLSDKAAEYWGCDPAPNTSKGVQAMFDDLSALTPERKKIAKLFCSAFEMTTDIEHASFDFALTSPPYYDVEKYEGAQSSWCLYRDFDAWVAGFYRPLFVRVSDALKPGALFALQVGSQSYPLKELAIKLGSECGFRHVETRHTDIVNNYNDTDPDKGEVIVIFEHLR